ncbi:PREDICTED: 21 kDa protein-like [Ipomoea nil]|uniref:21 kDa protein-like n=1 Tax=Ipomoea nil TaxID=35883 RepID=UPI0009017A22|nr:PREDICTED: 21 kDa protein-like [Ipomoea nil]
MARVLVQAVAVVVLSILYVSDTAESAAATVATSFIKTSCKATTYPDLCVTSLAAYGPTIKRSPQQLVQTALSVSVDRAQSTKGFVDKLCKFKGLKRREYGALKDCLDEMSDSVDRLSKSVRELKNMGRDFQWHISNAQTWISAALTDENTCMDGFAGRALNGKIKASIRARVTNVAQVTSNALALINQFASKYN